MRQYTICENGTDKEWLKIDKRTARTLYNKGVTILFCPCNMRPFGFWVDPSIKVNKESVNFSIEVNRDFDKLVNEFEFYNCNHETGRYTSFFRPLSVEESVNSLWC